MKFVRSLTMLAWTLCLLVNIALAQCPPRVRKNWNALTAQEKTTFIGALQSAMDSGAYPRFVEMHNEMMSEMEAHQQCMFIYWHRVFLLVFENMLRGQGAEFACVTVPYWDWITDHSRYASGGCRSMGECSSTLTDLGGVPGGIRQSTVKIYGYDISGFCVNARPLNHYCESSAQCSRCIPRGNWNAVAPPAASSYASVLNQIFSATSIGQFSPQIERGAHASVHADLDGVMATLLSPADPVFWAHHSMVDVLHVIFHKCRVGTARLSFEERVNHPAAWTSCGRRNGGAFDPNDVITMRTGGSNSGRAAVPGAQDPLIGRFFQGVPTRFVDLMDTRDLGYSYELSGVTATMYTQCSGASQPAASPVASTSSSVTAPSTQRWTFRWSTRSRRSLRSAVGFEAETNDDVSPSARVKARNIDSVPLAVNSVKQVALPVATEEPVTIIETPIDAAVQKVLDWYDEVTTALDGPSPKSHEEIERMTCMFQDECLGGVHDFSQAFQKTWGVDSPRCKRIVHNVRSGATRICVDDWKQQMIHRFGCPEPAGASTSTSPVQKPVV